MNSFARLVSILLLVFSISGDSVFAQIFSHISDRDGAPAGVLYAASQDPTGFMWFATLTGVYRYDAHSFKRFTHDPKDSTSLASDYTTALLSDSQGNVWICTRGGLCRYDNKNESFQTFRPNRASLNAISSDQVFCVIEDSKKNIWVGTDNGLDRVQIKNGKAKFDHFLQARPGEPNYTVQAITTGKSQQLWLATSNGLVLFDKGNARIFKADPDARLPLINDFTYIFNDGIGNIWLGVRKGGLMRFNISSEKFELMSGFKSHEGDWPDLSGFSADQPGKVWIATMSGLANFDLRTFQTEWHVNNPADRKSLADNVLMSIFKDRQGGLWIGSYTFGLDYLNPSTPVFSGWPFFVDRVAKNTFNSSWMGLTPDQKPWLLAGDKSKILFYDPATKQTNSYKLDLEYARNFNHFFVDEQGILWCGGAGFLYSYDFNRAILKSYRMPDLNRVPIEKRGLFTIFQDNRRQLWLGGASGILSFDKTTSAFHVWYNEDRVTSIFEDSKGNIWFGGHSYVRLIRDGRKKPENIIIKNNISREIDLRGNVWRFCEDPRGRIWLASSDGLKFYDPKTRQICPVDSSFKDIAGVLGDIQADRKGYLWINADRELVRFQPDSATIQLYNYVDGLPEKAALTLRGSQKDNQGKLFFNTSHEMFSFDPEKVLTGNKQETIVISSVRLFNKPLKAGDRTGILLRDVSKQEELVFAHDQNIFSLDFALLSFFRSHLNKYRYRLEGFDENWNETSFPSATYMNLPPGNYTFAVSAANGDGLWMNKALKVKIRILPPWWKTWYAYLAYALLLVAVIYTFTRFFWLRTSFRKENALNQLKLDFFTNVSHEIRTHLSLISGPLEKAYQQAAEGRNNENYLSYARSSSDRLMLLVNELLDFRKIQSGGTRLQVRQHDIVKIIKSVVSAFELIANEKAIKNLLKAPETPVFLWFDIAQMQKVFYNLLGNAYKFTPYGGKVTVRITELSNEVRITIEDNGNGISAEHLQKLFSYYYQADSEKPGYGIGLALSKAIVEQHHGYLTAESRRSEGTTLTIRLLRDKNHFNPGQLAANGNEYLSDIMAEAVLMPADNHVTDTKLSNTILIIEDNDQLRVFIRDLFEGEFNIIEAENGLQGLELASEHLPDIVLSDVMMPEMNGLEVCNKLKSNIATAHIPVVLLTARTQNEQVIEGLESGADDYLAKPFDPRILELKIRNLVRVRDELRAHYRQSALTDSTDGNTIAQDVNEAFIARIRSLVAGNLADPDFGVNELAAQVGMSVSVLYRKLRTLTGMTVNEFVKAIRLNEAKKFLESGVYNVAEVATMIGFDDSKYFSKEFRKVFGKNPNEFKKNTIG